MSQKELKDRIPHPDTAHVWALSRRRALSVLGAATLVTPALLLRKSAFADEMCRSTQSVPIEGPYFLGEAKERAKTGEGLVLRGQVKSAACTPITGARILRWHANEFGIYEDFYRATMISDTSGSYRMESILPGTYAGLQRHVHFLVTAPGYQDLITQWQIADGATPAAEGLFDFVLTPV